MMKQQLQKQFMQRPGTSFNFPIKNAVVLPAYDSRLASPIQGCCSLFNLLGLKTKDEQLALLKQI